MALIERDGNGRGSLPPGFRPQQTSGIIYHDEKFERSHQGNTNQALHPSHPPELPRPIVVDARREETNADNDANTTLLLPNSGIHHRQLELLVRLTPTSTPILTKGLQIPTRNRLPTSHFRLPAALVHAGVDKAAWEAFTNEINDYANLSGKEWAYVLSVGVGVGWLIAHLVPLLAPIPAGMASYKLRANQEKLKISDAIQGGRVDSCIERWNKTYFNVRNLDVHVEAPGAPIDMDNMDVSSSKLYKYLERRYLGKTPEESQEIDPNVTKYQKREGAAGVRASRKCRIVIQPLRPLEQARSTET